MSHDTLPPFLRSTGSPTSLAYSHRIGLPWTVDVQPPGDVNNQVIVRAMFRFGENASAYANEVNDKGLGYRVTMRPSRSTDKPFNRTEGN